MLLVYLLSYWIPSSMPSGHCIVINVPSQRFIVKIQDEIMISWDLLCPRTLHVLVPLSQCIQNLCYNFLCLKCYFSVDFYKLQLFLLILSESYCSKLS